ncbi:portal protein [Microbacterium phage Cen1621]|uniref:Portal protein n=1 Tax=Microbacterium phage Cen1621 TaxID=2965191 RepID=A0A9E7QAB3_9CAUD|nr:portal protein [Microbacterium phage Cen1621]
MDITPKLAGELDDKLAHDLKPDKRLGLPKRYLAGDHDLAYMPTKAKPEYRQIAERSIDNWLPLIPDEFTKGLAVDGFRAPRASDNVEAWRYWQDNGLDARQTIAHRGAFEYGTSYVLVLPGVDKSRPQIKPLSPLRSAAWYADDDDDYPELGLIRLDTFREGQQKRQRVAILDDTRVVYYSRPVEGGDMRYERTLLHGLGVTPLVRFRDRLDGEALGLVRPFKRHQDRINAIAFNIAMAMQYATFRQRWATGLAIPEDDDGNPVEPFNAAIDRLWISDDPNARFGDFAQTDIRGMQDEYKAAVASLAAAAQISPAILTGDLVNVSADALLAIRTGTNRKLDEYKLLFGESWELVLRLAAAAAGATPPPTDAETMWRDTSGDSFAAKVDGLGKLAQMLAVPQEALWEEVPGMTDSKLQRWRELAKPDALDSLTAEIMRQGAAAEATLGAAQPPAPAPTEPLQA